MTNEGFYKCFCHMLICLLGFRHFDKRLDHSENIALDQRKVSVVGSLGGLLDGYL